MANILWRAADF